MGGGVCLYNPIAAPCQLCAGWGVNGNESVQDPLLPRITVTSQNTNQTHNRRHRKLFWSLKSPKGRFIKVLWACSPLPATEFPPPKLQHNLNHTGSKRWWWGWSWSVPHLPLSPLTLETLTSNRPCLRRSDEKFEFADTETAVHCHPATPENQQHGAVVHSTSHSPPNPQPAAKILLQWHHRLSLTTPPPHSAQHLKARG